MIWGGVGVNYDTIRSATPDDFVSDAVCVESNDGSDTSATDSTSLRTVDRSLLCGSCQPCLRVAVHWARLRPWGHVKGVAVPSACGVLSTSSNGSITRFEKGPNLSPSPFRDEFALASQTSQIQTWAFCLTARPVRPLKEKRHGSPVPAQRN